MYKKLDGALISWEEGAAGVFLLDQIFVVATPLSFHVI
jgi:hypothetical protein